MTSFSNKNTLFSYMPRKVSFVRLLTILQHLLKFESILKDDVKIFNL